MGYTMRVEKKRASKNEKGRIEMVEIKNALHLEGLPGALGEPLTLLAEQLGESVADNLQSITVVGSALTDDFRAGVSDINTVLILGECKTAALNAIAALAKTTRKKKISPPLLMTASYIERSRDVFGVELLDFQLTHRTVLGADPFEALRFEKHNVRLQCERELKATLIRLRQGYIAAAGNSKLVRDVLIAAAKGLAPLLRAMLWLKDADRPRTMEATFRQGAAAFEVKLEAVVTAERWRYEKPRLTSNDIETAFESIYTAVEHLATTVDALEL